MTTTIVDARDELETAIIMALLMDKKRAAPKHSPKVKKGAWVRHESGMERFCPSDAAYPAAAYTFDASSEDRIYSSSLDDLVVNPVAAIGTRLEIMMLCEGGRLKWSCIRPMPRPRGLAAVTNQPFKWFAWHFREFRAGTSQSYVRRPLAITEGGDVCMIKPLGDWRGFDPSVDRNEMREQLAITLSVFEDAHRANAFLATVEEHVKLMFPVGADAYRSFLALRDGYRATPSGRRNPILHWCAEHLRQRSGKTSLVQEHLRGADEFIVGPMRLSLEPTQGYEAFLREQNKADATRPGKDDDT